VKIPLWHDETITPWPGSLCALGLDSVGSQLLWRVGALEPANLFTK
jgi:hypothetical protein